MWVGRCALVDDQSGILDATLDRVNRVTFDKELRRAKSMGRVRQVDLLGYAARRHNRLK